MPEFIEPFEYEHPATGCRKCPALVTGRHTVVWSSGPEQADIMLIGEAPGYNEDQRGLPFVGAAGTQLNRMLTEVGLSKREVHIANRLMCRPPGNRDPEPYEMENCEPWLWQNIRMTNPKALVLFGKYSQSLFFGGMHPVHQVEGLMYRKVCFDCGQMDGEHLPRFAWNGDWRVDMTETWECAQRETPRVLVAAIYHPASILGNRNPENRPRIIEQLRRVVAELRSSGN